MEGWSESSMHAGNAAAFADEARVPQPARLGPTFISCVSPSSASAQSAYGANRAPHTEPDERISQCLSAACELVAADDCLLVLVSQGHGQPMRLVARSNECSHSSAGCQAGELAHQAAAREAMRTGKPFVHAPVVPVMTAGTNLRRIGSTAHNIVASPIQVGGHTVGAVNLSRAGHRAVGSATDLHAIAAIAQLLGQAFYLNRLEQILNSQFAQLAIARQADDAPGNDAMLRAGADPERLARLLAKSFYREMTKLGLDSSQVIVAASEIISQLSGTVKRHRDRRDRAAALARA